MKTEELSSALSPWIRYGISFLLLLGPLSFLFLAEWKEGAWLTWLVVTLGILIFEAIFLWPLCQVRYRDQHFLIKRGLKRHQIPITEIESVRETVLSQPRKIILSTTQGQKFDFVPEYTWEMLLNGAESPSYTRIVELLQTYQEIKA